jgi:hypothetical protein
MSETIYDVIILGAGIAGLGAAYELTQGEYSNFLILEADKGPGGRARSLYARNRVFNMGASYDHAGMNSLLRRTFVDPVGLAYRDVDFRSSGGKSFSVLGKKVHGTELKERFLSKLTAGYQAACKKDPTADGRFEDFFAPRSRYRQQCDYWRGIWLAGVEADKVSTRDFMADPYGFGGLSFAGGMGALVQKMVEEIGARKIRYNRRVSIIEERTNDVLLITDKEERFRARKVIITASIDAIKNITFESGLSTSAQEQLAGLSMGQMEKVAFKVGRGSVGKEVSEGCRVDMMDREWPMSLHVINGTLTALIPGKWANKIRTREFRKSAGDIVMSKMDELRRVPGLKHLHVKGEAVVVTAWGDNPNIGGAYSCCDVGHERQGPIRNGRITIANEATDEKIPGHISGAWRQGLAAADIAEAYLTQHAPVPRAFRANPVRHPIRLQGQAFDYV